MLGQAPCAGSHTPHRNELDCSRSQGHGVQAVVLSFHKRKEKPFNDRDLGPQLVRKKKKQEAGSWKMLLLDELRVCRKLERGKEIHAKAKESGSDACIYIATALVNMYGKCGSMVDARRVFDSIKHPDGVSWNALILGYAENGEGIIALDLFERMKCRGFVPDSFTFVAAIQACTSLAAKKDGAEFLEQGRQIHSEIGHRSNIYVQSTLIDMYCKFGSMAEAHRVFDRINHPNAVSWNALILGYADNGEGVMALELFARMRSQGCAPTPLTFVSALKACSFLGSLDSGSSIHAEINSESGSKLAAIVVTSLVDFYAKCGCLAQAGRVFYSHPKTRDLTSWNALLAGYSRLGATESVFKLFGELLDSGSKPDAITLLSILTCCSHAGLVEKASELFESMPSKYGITPTIEHYSCMVDILGRSNKLDDALKLLRSMPCRPDYVTWMTVLDACRKWKNVEIGRMAFKSLVGLDDSNAAAYVLMADIYKSREMLEERDKVLAGRKSKGANERGRSRKDAQ